MKIIILLLPQKSLLVTFAVNFSCCNIFTAKVITSDFCGNPIFPTKNTLTLNRAGPNPTYSVRGGGQIWPLLKIEVSDTQKWSKSGILIFLANFQVILSNFCFHGNVEKITFWTTFVGPKILLIPIFALYRVTARGVVVRSDHFWKSNFQTPKSGPKSDFFGVLS